MKRTVFISHSSADKGIAEQVCAYLESKGIGCWVAPRDVTPGKNYGAAILDAIDECSIFLLILTSESNKSGQVVREVERAASANAVIIPVRAEEVQPSRNLEFYVSAAHWLDAITKPFNKHLPQLLQAVRNWQPNEEENQNAPPVVPAVPPVSPPARARPGPKLFGMPIYVIAALLVALLGLSVFGYLALRKRSASTQTIAASTPVASVPAPTIEPTPTSTMPPPVTAPNEMEHSSSPEPSESATAIRRRPGESLHSSPAADAAVPPAPAVSSGLRPGQSLGGAVRSAATDPAPVVRNVIASSQKGPHRANLVTDGNKATSWVSVSEGVGQTLNVQFKSPAALSSISVLNGNGMDEEHYSANNRVHSMRLRFSDGSSQLINLADKMEMQRFELEHRVTTDWVKCEIVSVYKGKRNNWTAISEIQFNTPK